MLLIELYHCQRSENRKATPSRKRVMYEPVRDKNRLPHTLILEGARRSLHGVSGVRIVLKGTNLGIKSGVRASNSHWVNTPDLLESSTLGTDTKGRIVTVRPERSICYSSDQFCGSQFTGIFSFRLSFLRSRSGKSRQCRTQEL